MDYPSYCCPKCGEQIGYIGRFFQFDEKDLKNTPSPIKPKTAIVEVDCPIDNFFDEWENDGDNIGVEPTQEDYDKWAQSIAMGFFERYRHELDNYIKLK